MKICPKCGAQADDSAQFCTGCGSPFGAYAPAAFDPYDHTGEFDTKDIADNKLLAMLLYLTGPIGMIIALLAAPQSDYVRFHVRQTIKILIAGLVVSLLTAVLVWTVIVPILGGIALLVLAVVDIICFIRVCKGQAKEAPIVCKIGFLK